MGIVIAWFNSFHANILKCLIKSFLLRQTKISPLLFYVFKIKSYSKPPKTQTNKKGFHINITS
jgi:hypothetical protein